MDDHQPVVLNTILEHNSNELPWRAVAGVARVQVDVNADGFVELAELEAELAAYNRDGNAWDAAAVASCCAAASVEGEGVAAIPDRAALEARVVAYRRRQGG